MLGVAVVTPPPPRAQNIASTSKTSFHLLKAFLSGLHIPEIKENHIINDILKWLPGASWKQFPECPN